MITDTSQKILGYLGTNKQAKAVDLVRHLGITNSAVHRQLNKLLKEGKITRVGKPPVVFYLLKREEKPLTAAISADLQDFINSNYVYVSPIGEFLAGMAGFTQWLSATNQERYLQPLALEYRKIRLEANTHILPGGWIDATQAKLQDTFHDTAIHKMLYKDFYSIEKFGKTQLGQMVLYAKISQNIKIIESIVDQVRPVINQMLETYNIDTIAYIPPSVKRNVQLMTELKNRLQIRLPEIVLRKVYTGDVVVSQKSLNKFNERVENARHTIFVDVNRSAVLPKNVLLIDDAVGSGATLHETAKQILELIKPKGIIMGFAIVGSIKGFEVIREI